MPWGEPLPTVRVTVKSLERDAERDDATRLVALVRRSVERRGLGAVAVVVRAERVELIGLRPLLDAGVSVHRFLAALTRSTVDGAPAEAVGVAGTVRARRSGVPVAVVFLEWGDCRWWQWRALVGTDDEGLREDTETVRSAVDGDPLPSGLGRWWSLGRRQRLGASFRRVPETVH